MNRNQEHHLKSIEETLVPLLRAKYIRGATEHDGDLLDMSAGQLIDEAISEAIDQMVYLITLKEKIVAASLKPGKDSPITPDERR